MNKDTVIKVHEFLTEYFAESEDPISPPGVKDEGLLDSAVVRKDMTAGNCDIFEGVFNKAAALFHGVINNHAFYNGNKRSALLSTIVYLGENGYWVTKCDDAEMFEFTRQIAAHELHEDRKQEISIIAEWLKLNSRRRDIREKRLNLQQLRDILAGFGFEISQPRKNRCEVIKDGDVVTTVRFKGAKGAEDYDVKYIKGLRQRLKLTPDYGVDSIQFYGVKGLEDQLNRYIEMRCQVMRWLAKI
ncbi:TPA: type II toxin-antitoxin system death-on-curing family toxin [Vibrio parahaemolyticus]|uniref:type II toxin-antitoxin system death-on-curing family toxin n=1 Tax=Vibrio parahaemolyticus TaxID=670 RepID=UPI000B791D15|nr:type II toxin-antitoxin system death-on-curing family toxin [Vibrio parahaemolyticus]EHE7894781.1 type II toxin-antitoxin system death-on-curing family toxin [Vibrio parahaemolyticus]EIQ7475596.1 type II toxin-antitoxin system death-on-curing family toxin [Vibrio parahaemolyticus]EJM7150597.1 type II toxin-antitoxin system death-on-curing family toxin [Vibrio parahaemolyticus]EKB1991453.1 type II toxin-antitoxin system death-on-curing family toxin [Vibrio parahaemolyticus]EKI0735280.1 type 